MKDTIKFLTVDDIPNDWYVINNQGKKLIVNADPHSVILLHEPTQIELIELTKGVHLKWCIEQWSYFSKKKILRPKDLNVSNINIDFEMTISGSKKYINEPLHPDIHKLIISKIERKSILDRFNYIKSGHGSGFNWCNKPYQVLLESDYNKWISYIIGLHQFSDKDAVGRWRISFLAEIIKKRWLLLPAIIFKKKEWLNLNLLKNTMNCKWSDTSSNFDNNIYARIFSLTTINCSDDISQELLDKLAKAWVSPLESQGSFRKHFLSVQRNSDLILEKPRSLLERNKLTLSDPEYAWVYNEDPSRAPISCDFIGCPSLKFLALEASSYLKTLVVKGIIRQQRALSYLFEFFLSLPTEKTDALLNSNGLQVLTRSEYIYPSDHSLDKPCLLTYFQNKYSNNQLDDVNLDTSKSNPNLSNALLHVKRFFEWLSEKHNIPHLQTLILNTDIQKGKANRPQKTHRDAIPPKFLNMMRDILINDGNWRTIMLESYGYRINDSPDENGWYWSSNLSENSVGVIAVKGDNRWGWARQIDSDWLTLPEGCEPRDCDAFRLIRYSNENDGVRDITQVWSPCRATIMSLYLHPIPVRFGSMQSADNGIHDVSLYDVETNSWQDNINATENERKSNRNLGIFRYYQDVFDEGITGLFFTNSKIGNNGQEIQYQPPKDLLRLIIELRDFNLNYYGPAPKINRRDFITRNGLSDKAAKLSPDFYPLFQDLANNNHKRIKIGFLITRNRFDKFMLLLLDHFEKVYSDLVDKGEANAISPIIICRYGDSETDWQDFLRKNRSILRQSQEFNGPKEHDGWIVTSQFDKVGNPILIPTEEKERELRMLFMKSEQFGKPLQARWDIHTLRVSGITALALAGLPIPILAEFMAGHLSILMDLYYVKIDKTAIQQMVEQAIQRIHYEPDLQSLLCFHHNEELSRHAVAALVHEDALNLLTETKQGDWLFRDGFLCPCNGTLCHSGSIEPVKERKLEGTFHYGMVEGGEGNCALCRFAVAGPFSLQQQFESVMRDLSSLLDFDVRFGLLMQNQKKASDENNTNILRSLRNEVDNLEKSQYTRWKTVLTKLEYLQQSAKAADKAEFINNSVAKGETIEVILQALNQKKAGLTLVTATDNQAVRLIARKAKKDGMDWGERIQTLGALASQIQKVDYNPGKMEQLCKQWSRRLKSNNLEPLHDLFEEILRPTELSDEARAVLNSALRSTSGFSNLFNGSSHELRLERYVDAMRHQFVSDQFNLLMASQIYLREAHHKQLGSGAKKNSYTDFFQRISELWTGKSEMTPEEKHLLQNFYDNTKNVFCLEDIQPMQLVVSFNEALRVIESDSSLTSLSQGN